MKVSNFFLVAQASAGIFKRNVPASTMVHDLTTAGTAETTTVTDTADVTTTILTTVGVLETVFDATTTEEITVGVLETFSEEPPVETDIAEVVDFCTSQGFSEDQIANGTQQVTSTCSRTVLGALPDVNNMISTIITLPFNGEIIPFGTNFTVIVVSSNIDFGFFDDPQTQYYITPQTLNENGLIKGHTHITVEKITDRFQPLDARFPVFFRGLNGPSEDGSLSVIVDGSAFEETGRGNYRICTITASSSHAPVLMPVARRGSQDDCIRVIII